MLILCKLFVLKEWIIIRGFVSVKYVHLDMVNCQNLAKKSEVTLLLLLYSKKSRFENSRREYLDV